MHLAEAPIVPTVPHDAVLGGAHSREVVGLGGAGDGGEGGTHPGGRAPGGPGGHAGHDAGLQIPRTEADDIENGAPGHGRIRAGEGWHGTFGRMGRGMGSVFSTDGRAWQCAEQSDALGRESGRIVS
jgi:hypothetical protein